MEERKNAIKNEEDTNKGKNCEVVSSSGTNYQRQIERAAWWRFLIGAWLTGMDEDGGRGGGQGAR